MDNRRRMMETAISGLLPDSYKQVEYVQRGTSVDAASGYRTTGFTIDPQRNTEIHIGMMAIAQQQSNYGYVVGCRQTNRDNTIGRGIYVPINNSKIGMFNGVSLEINGTVLNVLLDIIAKFNADGSMELSNGTDTVTEVNAEPRGISSELYFFGFKKFDSTQNANPFRGRIYYMDIYEDGVLKCKFVPAVKLDDNTVGLYDIVNGSFRSNTNFTAGPDV